MEAAVLSIATFAFFVLLAGLAYVSYEVNYGRL